MPTAERRQTAHGTKYRAGWRDQDGIQRWGKAIHDKRKDAVAEGLAEEKKVAAGRASKDRQITWAEWCPQWLATRQAAGSNTANVVGKWLMPKWGPVKLRDITPYAVRVWLKELAEAGAKPWTVQRNLSLLRTSLDAAAEVPYLDTTNPCYGIKAPRPTSRPGVAFSQAEAQAIVEHLTGPYRTAAIVLVWMGLRFGEMAGMHWADVYEQQRKVYVSHTWDRHGRRMKAYPKDEDCRWVGIPLRVAAAIGERPASWREPCGEQHLPGDECPGQLVIPGPLGAPLDSHNMLQRHWSKAIAAAGLDRGRQHDARHTYITWLIEAGMSAAEVAVIVGHSETWVTERYTHLLSKHHAKALDILDQLGIEQAAAQPTLRLITP